MPWYFNGSKPYTLTLVPSQDLIPDKSVLLIGEPSEKGTWVSLYATTTE